MHGEALGLNMGQTPDAKLGVEEVDVFKINDDDDDVFKINDDDDHDEHGRDSANNFHLIRN